MEPKGIKFDEKEESELDFNHPPQIAGHDIRGFPTIKIVKNNKEFEYRGKRTPEEFTKYIESLIK